MSNSPDAKVFHILLVEDNAADIYLLRQALERAGLTFELTVIKDGSDALTFARSDGKLTASRVPDLVILDLNLPKIGGCEVLEALRQNVDLSNLTVAVMTSSAASQDQEKCTALGVARYITKPLGLEDFLQIGEVVKQVLLESMPGQHTVI
jgi:two-component system, chemotaxis family, response regulator Rcp1